jgi:hypothetical protein
MNSLELIAERVIPSSRWAVGALLPGSVERSKLKT